MVKSLAKEVTTFATRKYVSGKKIPTLYTTDGDGPEGGGGEATTDLKFLSVYNYRAYKQAWPG